MTWPSKGPLTCKGNPPELLSRRRAHVAAACASARFDYKACAVHTAVAALATGLLATAFRPDDIACGCCGHHICSCQPEGQAT